MVGAGLAFPKRAAAIGLRAHVLAAGLRTPHRRITALAEVAARVATAGVLRHRIKCGALEHAAISRLLVGAHPEILAQASQPQQYDSLRRRPVGTTSSP